MRGTKPERVQERQPFHDRIRRNGPPHTRQIALVHYHTFLVSNISTLSQWLCIFCDVKSALRTMNKAVVYNFALALRSNCQLSKSLRVFALNELRSLIGRKQIPFSFLKQTRSGLISGTVCCHKRRSAPCASSALHPYRWSYST